MFLEQHLQGQEKGGLGTNDRGPALAETVTCSRLQLPGQLPLGPS